MAEIYEGIKFINKNQGSQFKIPKRIEVLKKWCAIFHEKNFAPPYLGGSSGNLSFRLKPGKPAFLITATATSLQKNMEISDFVWVEKCNLPTFETFTFGTKEPSSETFLHNALYKTRPEINAVFHGHSSEILTAAKKIKIPETKIELPYGTKDVITSVLEILEQHNFVIIKNHGFISLANTIEKAGNQVYEILNKL